MEEKELKTTLSVSHECWKAINERKNVGDSMEDVIMRALLEEPEKKQRSKKK